MIRFSLRTLGFLLIAAAFAGLVIDGTRSIAGGHLLQYSLGDAAAWAGGARFTTWYDTWVEGASRLAEPMRRIASAVLAAPGWIVTGGLGLLLLHAGRPPATPTGSSDRRTRS